MTILPSGRVGRWRLFALALLLLIATLVLYVRRFRVPQLRLSDIRLPAGFTIAVYARAPGARSLALGDSGLVFVGTRSEGVVYALVDRDRDGTADDVVTIARGLDVPNGVAVHDGALYVAETSRILRYDRIESRLHDPPAPVVVTTALPTEEHHGWRYIGFGPDGWLYVGSGAPCNVCTSSDERFASILRMRPDGAALQVYARGVRNSVGFDWNRATGELWFTDNGRDWLGEDRPPDELNRAPAPGLHFGFPYCHGTTLADPEFAGRRCADFVPPELELGPHVAALGMRFYGGTLFPPAYRNQIFIAEHGSWNRLHQIGYRVALVRLAGGRAVSYEPFAEGWLRAGRASGRPVDVLVMSDGALLVSDDRAGVVYRIAYQGAQQ